MIGRKRNGMKLSALLLACTCFVTSVYTPYLGFGNQTVFAQEIQTEDAPGSDLSAEQGVQDDESKNLPGGV